MAGLKWVYKHRYLILVWTELEILLFSAIVFGWAALVIVLKQENIFRDLCEAKHEGNSTSITEDCVTHYVDKLLDLAFRTGVLSFNGTGIVSGPFLDRFGPKKTRLLSSLLIGLAFLFFLLAENGEEILIFPGLFMLSAAGLIILMTNYQVANMFDRWKFSVISSFSGAVDSSSVVLLICKFVYDAGFPLRSIIIFYCLFALISTLAFTFILPANIITPEAITEAISDEFSPLCQSDVEDETDENDEVENIDGESSEDSAPGVISQMLTAEYILAVLYLSVCNLLLWFYVGYFNSYLEFMSDNDKDTVSKYTNWFGVIQCTGFFFAPIVGFVMDWKPKKKRNEKTDIGFVAGYLLTSFVALLLNILVLVPILSVQYASFLVDVVLRAFNYSVFAAFIVHKFPILQFGTLYGVGNLILAAIGSLQYGLFAIVEDTLEQDPFWVNVSLLVLCLFLNILPALLWIKEKRHERQNVLG